MMRRSRSIKEAGRGELSKGEGPRRRTYSLTNDLLRCVALQRGHKHPGGWVVHVTDFLLARGSRVQRTEIKRLLFPPSCESQITQSLPLSQEPNKHPVKSRSHIPVLFHLTGLQNHILYSNPASMWTRFAMWTALLQWMSAGLFVEHSYCSLHLVWCFRGIFHGVVALTWSASFLQHSADKWKFCPYCGLGRVKASEGISEQPIWLTQILILPLNRPLAACFMGLFSTRHFECCSIHGLSFPRTAFSLPPCSFLSPSRLRGLVSQASGNWAPLCEDETSKSASMTRRSRTLTPRQQLLLFLCLSVVEGFLEVNKEGTSV